MGYGKGELFYKEGIVFKSNDSVDEKGRRPTVVPIATTDDNRFVYVLSLTSQVDRYFEFREAEEQYYLLKKDDVNNLRKTSLVNLMDIYKFRLFEPIKPAFGHLKTDDYVKMIEKFKFCQKFYPDEDYWDEIKHKI